MTSCVSLSNLSYCQKSIESETVKTSEVLKKTLGSFSESVKGVSSVSVSPFTRAAIQFDFSKFSISS